MHPHSKVDGSETYIGFDSERSEVVWEVALVHSLLVEHQSPPCRGLTLSVFYYHGHHPIFQGQNGRRWLWVGATNEDPPCLQYENGDFQVPVTFHPAEGPDLQNCHLQVGSPYDGRGLMFVPPFPS